MQTAQGEETQEKSRDGALAIAPVAKTTQITASILFITNARFTTTTLSGGVVC